VVELQGQSDGFAVGTGADVVLQLLVLFDASSPTPSGSRADVKPTSSKLNTTPYAIASGSADATVVMASR
jgi:hypothetical protein